MSMRFGRRGLAARLTDIVALLRSHVPQARQILRKVLDGCIVCEPYEEGNERGIALWRVETVGHYWGNTGVI